MSDVLVIQPDSAQAETLRDIFRRVGAELVIVESTREAMNAIGFGIPDLILLSALLSPRDEDALMSYLRSLDGASHLQTITIPQFQTGERQEVRKSAFSFFKKQKAPVAVGGCDPAAFAEEVTAHLKRAQEIRSRPVMPRPAAPVSVPPVHVEAVVPIPSPEPVGPVELPRWEEAAAVAADVPGEAAPVDLIAEFGRLEAPTEWAEAHQPAVPMLEIGEDDIDRLARQLGLDVKVVEVEEPVPVMAAQPKPAEDFDFGLALDQARAEAESRRIADLARAEADAEAIRELALAEARATAEREAREAVAADLARVQAEAEAMREAAIIEARAAAEREAREAVAADLARVQAEAEAMREAAIAEARAAAEREARERLEAELARVRSETEVTVADAINRVKLEAEDAERARVEAERLRAEAQEAFAARARQEAEEAERARIEAERLRVEAQQAFAAELARVRAEVEQSLAAQLEASRLEAERMREAEAAAARERAAAETTLKSEIDRLKFIAAQTRKADESETRRAGEQIRQLETELQRVRAQSDERQAAQLEEIRQQMAEMREAAAQQARAAAAEAVASEVARATSQTGDGPARKLNVVRMQPRHAPVEIPAVPSAVPITPPAPIAASEPAPAELSAAAQPATSGGDYYSLWQSASAVSEEKVEEVADEPAGPRFDFLRHAKWALPVAACLLLVTNTGPAISTVARLMSSEEKPVLTVEPIEADPFIEEVNQKVGRLQVETTPAGADVVIGGKSYGKTPITIPDLAAGTHTVVLKSSEGTLTRRVSVKAGQTASLSEAIFSGWLAVFSPIPVTVILDGKAVNLTDDGRLMASPGKHVLELASDRFNFRTTETLEVKPGETTAYTLSLPMGSLRVTAPEGVEIRIDGQLASGDPAEGLAVPIGSHEVKAIHPALGERQAAVDVMHGSLTEVTLQFE